MTRKNTPTPEDLHRTLVETTLIKIFGKKQVEFVVCFLDHYELRLSSSDDTIVTFTMLEEASQVFGTKDINFKHEEGWEGEEGSGEPSRRWITIARVAGKPST